MIDYEFYAPITWGDSIAEQDFPRHRQAGGGSNLPSTKRVYDVTSPDEDAESWQSARWRMRLRTLKPCRTALEGL